MFKNLQVFQTAYAMARHAGARQAVTAANMANADTPGYRAKAIGPFAETVKTQSNGTLRTTRTAHLGTGSGNALPTPIIAVSEASPNGNAVSLEQEMINGVEIQREHNRALAIYKHSLDVLRTSIGRR